MRKTVNALASYIDALRPIIYFRHFDFKVLDEVISEAGNGVNILEFNNALCMIDFETKTPMFPDGMDLEAFLKLTLNEGFQQETFLVLKDVHGELNSPKIISLLKRIAERQLYNDNFHTTILIVSEVTVIPSELENYITLFDFPLPTKDEISELIYSFVDDLKISVSEDVIGVI